MEKKRFTYKQQILLKHFTTFLTDVLEKVLAWINVRALNAQGNPTTRRSKCKGGKL